MVRNCTHTVFVILLQDAQHREAMGSLHTAERSSLISEIHQLRDQLEQVHHGDPIDRSPVEQKEGRPADGAVDCDRLLVDELKGELSQTKLELETTLQAQYKHLKELDTLRLDVIFVHRYVVNTVSVLHLKPLDKKCKSLML